MAFKYKLFSEGEFEQKAYLGLTTSDAAHVI